MITFEASRSDLQILDSLKENHFETEVGPGVYDIHSPRVPSVEEIVKALHAMLTKIDKDKLWVNPDCGLKPEVYRRQMPVFVIWWLRQNRSGKRFDRGYFVAK